MEQGTLTTPNIASLNKITGKAIFFETGVSGGIDFGDIMAHKLDYGIEREKDQWAIDGAVVLAAEDAISVAAVFSIEGKQFHTQMNPLLLLGTANADVVQSSATGATTAITAKLGKTFDIGARNITNVVVTVSAATKVADVDYFLEANKGIIRFPNVAAGIAAEAAVVVTYDKPAITRESITAFTKLNRQGSLKIFEMDALSAIPRAEWTLPGTLSADNGGEGDRAKAQKWTVRFAVNGQPTVLRRQT